MTGAGVPGVYGLRLIGLRPNEDLLARVDPGAPGLTVHRTAAPPALPPEDHRNAGLVLRELIDGAGTMAMWLDARRVEFALTATLSDDELVHPWLAPAAAAMALRDGRLAMHGGVLEVDGRCIALVGDREAGKSTLVAAAAMDGIGVLTDDVVVVDDDLAVHAGPRCIDLRPASAGYFAAKAAVPARGGTRRRLPLPQTLARAPLAAVVVLGWGPVRPLRRLRGTESLAALLPHLASDRAPTSFGQVLALASRPVFALSRPKEWSLLPATLERLVRLAASSDGPEQSEGVPVADRHPFGRFT